MDIFSKRKKNVDNIYLHYLGNEFKKIFGETKKNGCGWFEPLKKKPNKDPIKIGIDCFIPEKKYGKILMDKSLGELGYKYKSNSKKVGMTPDYFIEKLGLIFEFDGPIHYQNTFKIGSTYGDPDDRAEELTGTGHLYPFKTVFKIKIKTGSDCLFNARKRIF